MANKIFKNQTLLTLRFNTGVDLSDIATAIVKYRNSSGTIGQWTGVIANPATDGIVEYSSYNGQLDAGTYTVWVVLTDNQNKVLPTESGIIRLHTEGD